MSKDIRQRAILDLVANARVQTQAGLAEALAARGMGATQATISRDIQELGLVRTAGGYDLPGTASTALRAVVGFTLVEFIAVIRTQPGAAQMVARVIDEAGLAGVAGTVAGDDTIISVLEGATAAAPLRRLLGVG